jgi:hypothetical protein
MPVPVVVAYAPTDQQAHLLDQLTAACQSAVTR